MKVLKGFAENKLRSAPQSKINTERIDKAASVSEKKSILRTALKEAEKLALCNRSITVVIISD